MTLVPFSPPPGINSDDTTFSQEGRWADGNNVRFWQGKPQVIGRIALAGGTLGAGVRDLHAYYKSTTLYIAYGGASKLWVGAGVAAPTERTPSPHLGGGSEWSLDNFGSLLMAAVRGGTLYKFDQGVDALATVVTNAPDNITCILVTPQRQVMALGCNEETSGTFNGACIRWSDLEDYTDWTTTATNNAGEHILEGGGNIVAAKMVGSYVAVWTSAALHIGTFEGDPGQTYRFDKVADCGIIAARAVTVDETGTAYWMAPTFIVYRWRPGMVPEPVPCPIMEDLRDNVNVSLKAKIAFGRMGAFNEIWIFYGDNRDTIGDDQSTRYIAYSTTEGTWFRGQRVRFGILESGAASAVSASSGIITVMTNLAGNTVVHEVGPSGFAGGETLTWHITSADQYLDNSGRRLMLRSFVLDFEDLEGSATTLTVYVRARPQSTAVTKGPYGLTSSATKKDFRVSGKIFSVKFSGSGYSGSNDLTHMRLGKPLFDAVPMGER